MKQFKVTHNGKTQRIPATDSHAAKLDALGIFQSQSVCFIPLAELSAEQLPESCTTGKGVAKMKHYTIEIEQESEWLGWDLVFGDSPVDLLYFERFGMNIVHSGANDVPAFDNLHLLLAIDNCDYQTILNESNECENWRYVRKGVYCEWDAYSSRGTYKNIENAARAAFLREYGVALADLGFHQISTRGGNYWIIWNRKELDNCAGTKNATAPIGTVQSVLADDIWRYDILDENDDSIESCGGFIGDADYCQQEAQSALAGILKRDSETRCARLKELIRNRVPLRHRERVLIK